MALNPARLSPEHLTEIGDEEDSECNAAGQWGWLAEECGLPIAEAIADELTGDDQ